MNLKLQRIKFFLNSLIVKNQNIKDYKNMYKSPKLRKDIHCLFKCSLINRKMNRNHHLLFQIVYHNMNLKNISNRSNKKLYDHLIFI